MAFTKAMTKDNALLTVTTVTSFIVLYSSKNNVICSYKKSFEIKLAIGLL